MVNRPWNRAVTTTWRWPIVPSSTLEQRTRVNHDDLLRRAREEQRRNNQRNVVRLTKREFEVFSLILQGYSSQEVADILYVSKRTVDFHLANVYDKLRGKVKRMNRVLAGREAIRLGLIPFEPIFGKSLPLAS
jgi:DNA-binding CsgD family transcriptional regulator